MTIASDATVTDALPFAITPAAVRRVATLAAAEPAARHLRVTISGGGCAGFRYDFSLDGTRHADDVALVKDGVTVLVDRLSLDYLEGATIDFEESLAGARFVVRNPNAHGTCGCGSSFAA